MNIFDPTMTVPPDVAAAADKLTNYFADRGFSDWRLNGCASREQLEFTANLLERTASENEALAQRLAVRMEELQQAVQARLAAEKERDQLLAALDTLAPDAMAPYAGSPYEEAKIDGWNGAVGEIKRRIAAVKGEKPADDRSVIEEFVAVWFEATEEWVAVLPNGHVLRGKWGAVGYAVNAALEYLGRGEAEFDVLDLGGDGPTFRYVKNDEHWQEGGAQ